MDRAQEKAKCGAKLRKCLLDANYTQTQLAKELDVRPKDVHQWTLIGVPARLCFEVGRILNVNPEWLITTKKVSPNVVGSALETEWAELIASATPAQLNAVRTLLAA